MNVLLAGVLYCPNKNLVDLAVQSYESFHSKDHNLTKIGIVTNWSKEARDRLSPMLDDIFYSEENILSRAWNIAIHHGIRNGYDYILLPNVDVIARPDTIDNLIEGAINNPDHIMWCAKEYRVLNEATADFEKTGLTSPNLQENSFSFFVITRDLPEKVGDFFEGFQPAYFEDLDMIDRIREKGESITIIEDSRYFHYGSATIKNNGTKNHSHNFLRNKSIYEKRKKLREGRK